MHLNSYTETLHHSDLFSGMICRRNGFAACNLLQRNHKGGLFMSALPWINSRRLELLSCDGSCWNLVCSWVKVVLIMWGLVDKLMHCALSLFSFIWLCFSLNTVFGLYLFLLISLWGKEFVFYAYYYFLYYYLSLLYWMLELWFWHFLQHSLTFSTLLLFQLVLCSSNKLDITWTVYNNCDLISIL